MRWRNRILGVVLPLAIIGVVWTLATSLYAPHGVLPVAEATAKGRVVILGFDGADPHLARQMMDAGQLPNLKKLQDQGSFQPLGSSNPPQSPTAWSSFNTCTTPLNHGIYDFLRRTPRNYIPGVGFGSTQRAELAADGTVAKPPQYVNNRKGENFWKIASDQGVRVKALLVPFAYPADDLSEECLQLCGLDVPDIRGTQSTYFAFSDAFTAEEPVAGGLRMPLQFSDNVATVQVPGIGIPGTRPLEYARVPLTVKVDRGAQSVTVEIQRQTRTLKQGEWTDWMEWTFDLSAAYAVKAVSRFHVTEANSKVRLYMTCLNIHPAEPMMPISEPQAYSGALAERYGPYKTVGWEYDTKALQQGDMTEEMFLEDVERTMAWQEQLTLDELDAGNFDLFLSAWTATDRVSHMFWAYRDPKHPLYTEALAEKYGDVIEKTYIKMDEIIGKVMDRLGPEDLLMIMSDHGFHSFRTEFSVNTWLVRNGYLAIKGKSDPATAFTDDRFLQGFDWPNSRAYALGLGMVFLNLQGREGQGTVPPEDAPALIEELRDKLMQVTDPDTGDPVFRNIYTFINPVGRATEDTPDIQLGYAEGYQTSKASAAGAAPEALFSPNTDKWSGEHASSDVEFTQGILFSNQPLADKPTLLDLGVTAFEHLGLMPPEHFEGKNLLAK